MRAARANLRVAIVCDWLTGIGGAERVILELHRLFPKAPIYTSQYDPSAIDWFKKADVRTTWLQKIPKQFKKFMPLLRVLTFSRLDLSDYDLVISSTGAEAKGVKTGPKTVHISYVHAPTHYYWSRYEDYLKHPGFPRSFNWIARLALRLLVGPLRKWDFKAAQKPDYIITNSSHSQSQIKKYYGRNSTVIHPPVEVDRFAPKSNQKRRDFVVAGRQTPYKRIDLAVAACSKLDAPMTVIGDGPDHQLLCNLAGDRVTFLTHASDKAVAEDFQSAWALIFPGLDDFGIVAVEAMAAGTPVIAFKGGGALDYVIPGKTGLFFEEQTVDSLAAVIKSFRPSRFDHDAIRRHAQQFRPEAFRQKITRFVNQKLHLPQNLG